jgi:uncharacterized protein YjbI with pentapeptide repeats
MPILFQKDLDAMILAHERQLKGQLGGQRLDVSMQTARGLTFNKRNVSDADFVGAMLDNSCFIETQMRRCNLFGASMVRCDLQGADLSQADLRGSHLRSANFTHAVLNDANFGEGALVKQHLGGDIAPVHNSVSPHLRMSDTIFKSASAERAKFSSAISLSTDLSLANFSGAKLCGVSFVGSNLYGASFRNADLKGCDFSSCNMNSVILSGAILDNTLFDDADMTASMIDSSERYGVAFARAKMTRMLENLDEKIKEILTGHHLWVMSMGQEGTQANLAGFSLENVCLEKVQLQAANLRHSLLANAIFKNGIFSMADCAGCNAMEGIFVGSDCRGTNFSGANLEGVDLRETDCSPMVILTGFRQAHPVQWSSNFSASNMRRAQMQGGNFAHANFERCVLAECDFRDANLEGASLVDADFTGSDLRNAKLDGADMRGTIGLR